MTIRSRFFAAAYDREMAKVKTAGLSAHRESVLTEATGRVLEIGRGIKTLYGTVPRGRGTSRCRSTCRTTTPTTRCTTASSRRRIHRLIASRNSSSRSQPSTPRRRPATPPETPHSSPPIPSQVCGRPTCCRTLRPTGRSSPRPSPGTRAQPAQTRHRGRCPDVDVLRLRLQRPDQGEGHEDDRPRRVLRTATIEQRHHWRQYRHAAGAGGRNHRDTDGDAVAHGG